MLNQLQIKNFALIEQLTLDFSPHLNVLTGETGAGKSILIDAIRFVLGERFDLIRAASPPSTEKPSTVEAVFSLSNRKLAADPDFAPFFEPGDEFLILRREHQADRSRCWVNGRAANLSALKQIAARLLDIHGQYDHELLLDAGSHQEWIDRFGKIDRTIYEALYGKFHSLAQRREQLLSLEAGRERELDLLKYQIEEIERARLAEDEEEEIQTERIRLANSEKLSTLVSRILQCLNEEEASVSQLLAQAARDFTSLAKLDASLEPLRKEYEDAQLTIEEMIRALGDYREKLSFDPERLEEIDKRLDVIDLLKRKYGGSIPEVLRFFSEAKKKYDQTANAEVYQKDLEKEINAILPRLQESAAAISEKRKKSASELERVIEKELADLGMPGAAFSCEIQDTDFSPAGRDRAEFLIRINAGHPLLPMRKIVSAGEVSRVMLAMKKALVKADPVETLIFDEIDANIGGRLGSVVGAKLKEIAGERQVLLITHLPQIASFADRHFKVIKNSRKAGTVVEYQLMEGEERVRELAQMMSGRKETEISRKHAEEMLSRVKG